MKRSYTTLSTLLPSSWRDNPLILAYLRKNAPKTRRGVARGARLASHFEGVISEVHALDRKFAGDFIARLRAMGTRPVAIA